MGIEAVSINDTPEQALDKINNHDNAGKLGMPVKTEGIAAGAVTAEKIATGAVTAEKIPDKTIGTEKLTQALSDLISQSGAGGANAPGHYERDVPFYFYHKTVIASPNRLWLNIAKKGYLIENQHTYDISTDAVWDSNAQRRQAKHNYVVNDVVYPSATKTGYYYRCTTAGTSSSLTPTFPTVIGGTYNDGDVVWICEKDYTVAANRLGMDFYIYACAPESGTEPVILISVNATVPLRYTADNSRKVGGFHCECADVGTPAADHWLKGWVIGDILPFSVWDLNHRPREGSPEGMAWIPGHGWLGIYFLSSIGTTTDRKLATKYGGTIADGTSSPTWCDFDFIETLAKQSQSLPINDMLTAGGLGTPTGVAIKGAADPGTTGGHLNTSNTRIISYFGIEDGAGVMWAWSKDISYDGSCRRGVVSGDWSSGGSSSPRCVGVSTVGALNASYAARASSETVGGENSDVLELIKARIAVVQAA